MGAGRTATLLLREGKCFCPDSTQSLSFTPPFSRQVPESCLEGSQGALPADPSRQTDHPWRTGCSRSARASQHPHAAARNHLRSGRGGLRFQLAGRPEVGGAARHHAPYILFSLFILFLCACSCSHCFFFPSSSSSSSASFSFFFFFFFFFCFFFFFFFFCFFFCFFSMGDQNVCEP